MVDSPAQSSPASGSGVAARPRAITRVDSVSSARVRFWLPLTSDQLPLTCTDLVVSPSAARSCCSACVRVCKFSAGPATAANTHPHTSTPSATVPRDADPTPHLALSISDPRLSRPSERRIGPEMADKKGA